MRRSELDPGLHQLPGHLGLGQLQHAVGGPGPLGIGQRRAAAYEAAFALLGVDPPVLPQRAQGLDDRRPRDAELAHELVL